MESSITSSLVIYGGTAPGIVAAVRADAGVLSRAEACQAVFAAQFTSPAP
jgi:hypothetical protein